MHVQSKLCRNKNNRKLFPQTHSYVILLLHLPTLSTFCQRKSKLNGCFEEFFMLQAQSMAFSHNVMIFRIYIHISYKNIFISVYEYF